MASTRYLLLLVIAGALGAARAEVDPANCTRQFDLEHFDHFGSCMGVEPAKLTDEVMQQLDATMAIIAHLQTEWRLETENYPDAQVEGILDEPNLCHSRCYIEYPIRVIVDGAWWDVVRTERFYQYIHSCYCDKLHCSDFVDGDGIVEWYGSCDKLYRYEKMLLAYNGCYLAWKWVKVPNGCTCRPYTFKRIVS